MKKDRPNMRIINRVCVIGTNWEKFDIVTDSEIYRCEAKVFSEGSKYGIQNGRVSKLFIVKLGREVVAHYERAWEKKPRGIGKKIVDFIVDFYEKNKPLFCDMDTSSW